MVIPGKDDISSSIRDHTGSEKGLEAVRFQWNRQHRWLV